MATLRDLHILPRVRDSLSYLYVEHCRIDQEAKAVSIQDAIGKTPVPCAALPVLMMGPGTTITHAATRVLAENGCLAIWSGEEGVRMYAQGMPKVWEKLVHRVISSNRPSYGRTKTAD